MSRESARALLPFLWDEPVSFIDQTTLRNRLLRQLAPKDFARLAAHLEPVALPKDAVLSEPDQPFAFAFFPQHGIGSIIATSPERQKVESGLFGRDGFAPAGLALAIGRSPRHTIIQVPGEGHRLPTGAPSTPARPCATCCCALSTRCWCRVPTRRSRTPCTPSTSASRWLLMCYDRAVGDEIALTHEFLSIMLAVHRPSVTTALHMLEGNHFIHTERGVVTVTSRGALEEFAGDAYGRPEGEYERLLGPLR